MSQAVVPSSVRLLADGVTVTFRALARRLQEGERIVAVWTAGLFYRNGAQVVDCDETMKELILQNKLDVLKYLRFYASPTGSTRPEDYRLN